MAMAVAHSEPVLKDESKIINLQNLEMKKKIQDKLKKAVEDKYNVQKSIAPSVKVTDEAVDLIK